MGSDGWGSAAHVETPGVVHESVADAEKCSYPDFFFVIDPYEQSFSHRRNCPIDAFGVSLFAT